MKKNTYKKLKIIWNKNSVFNSLWYSKFINQFIKKGRKDSSEKKLFTIFKQLKSHTLLPHTQIFEIFFLTKPYVILTWIRKAKIYHQIPKIITLNQQYRLSLYLFSKLLILNNRKKKLVFENKFILELSNIIYNHNSYLLDYKQDLYNISIYNRSLLHFKW